MTKKKKMLLVLLIIFFVIISITLTFIIRENILRRAEHTRDEFKFDGMLYKEIDYKEILPYKETYNAVCKTIDGGCTLYEIKQYPDHEYLVARWGRDACVVKRVR